MKYQLRVKSDFDDGNMGVVAIPNVWSDVSNMHTHIPRNPMVPNNSIWHV